MDQGNDVIRASVNRIIATLSPTLYALSIHWTKEFHSGSLSIPDLILVSFPRLAELYLCVNLRSYTYPPTRDTFPKSTFHKGFIFPKKFEGLRFPALQRLRFAGLAWSAVESPYKMVTRMAPNLTHLRAKTDPSLSGMGGCSYPFPHAMKVFIEVPDKTLRDGDGEAVECAMNDNEMVRSIGHDPKYVTVIGMCIHQENGF